MSELGIGRYANEPERIEVVTTDQGPFADDVFCLLVGDVNHADGRLSATPTESSPSTHTAEPPSRSLVSRRAARAVTR